MNDAQYIIQQLKERVEGIREALAQGRVVDFYEYKTLCGRAQGLTMAIELIEELSKKRTREDAERD